MQITQKDVDHILKELREHNFMGGSSSLKSMTDHLLGLLTASPFYAEMVQTIKGEGLKHTIMTASGEVDKGGLISGAMGTSIQLGIMAGCIMGFRLGERNAGLELGLGVEVAKEAPKEAK